MAVQVDVSVADSVRGMVDVVVREHGRIDVLVNNAGFGFAATVVETEETDWDRLMSVNLKGVYLGCKYVRARDDTPGWRIDSQHGLGSGPCGGGGTGSRTARRRAALSP